MGLGVTKMLVEKGYYVFTTYVGPEFTEDIGNYEAHLVSMAINGFVSNFQTAFKPQVMKGFAAKEMMRLRELICDTSKYSYILLFAIICPFIANIDYILGIWLKDVPEFTSSFCILLLIENLFYALSGPMWMIVYADGRLKWYQISIFVIEVSTLPVAYILLRYGFSPIIVIMTKCFISLLVLLDRLVWTKWFAGLSIRRYVKEVLKPVLLLTAFTILALMPVTIGPVSDGTRLYKSILLYVFIFPLLTYYLALSKRERLIITEKIKKK